MQHRKLQRSLRFMCILVPRLSLYHHKVSYHCVYCHNRLLLLHYFHQVSMESRSHQKYPPNYSKIMPVIVIVQATIWRCANSRFISVRWTRFVIQWWWLLFSLVLFNSYSVTEVSVASQIVTLKQATILYTYLVLHSFC